MEDKIKLGIVGVGNMGSGHTNNVKAGKTPNVEIVAVCDVLEERRMEIAEQYPDIKIFDNYSEMLNSGLIDSVLVATPHYDHPKIAIEAFEKGLNVMIEKPAGVYTKQVLEMNEVASRSDKIFGIMYNQRTNPVYQKLREMIQRGDLGHIKRITWIITDRYRPQAYHNSSSWRSTWKTEGGGALINQNPHQLDLWQWLFGMPDKIYAKAYFGKYYDIEVEDDVIAFMEYENGTTGEYITSTGEAPGTNRLEIACDMGKVVVENNTIVFDRNIMSEREYNKINTSMFANLEHWKCEIPADFSGGEQHVGILNNFANAVLKGEELLAPGEEGINGLTISNAIHYSAWENKWVDVKNFPHDEFFALLQEKIATSKPKPETKAVKADTTGTY